MITMVMALSVRNDAQHGSPIVPGFREFFGESSRAFFAISATVLNGALWALVYFFIGTGEETVVLRYNVYFGIDLTGRASQAFLVPFLASALLLTHGLLAFIFFRNHESFLSLLLLLSAFLVQIAAAIAVLALVLVN